jgi:AraC-like DNA-binding protein
MQPWQIIILAFSGLGIFNSLAFVIYLHIARKQSFYKNLFLQIILLAFIIQITHALLELFQWQFSPYTGNLYLIGIYCQGPSMYLFIRKSLNPQWLIWPKQFIIHYAPWLIISSLRYNFGNPGLKEWIAVYLVGIQLLVYILLCIKPYLAVRKLYRQKEKKYFLISYLFPAFAFLWITFPFSGITKINYQIIESILHSAFLYYLIFLKIKEPKSETDKYRFSGIDETASQKIFAEIINAIREKELFLDPDISLTLLAKKVSLQVNILSQVINQNSHSNFRDFINTFRIEKAKTEIRNKAQKGFTIASVAFDCGFNSLSAFNRAFKKATGNTPSEYIQAWK